jgi:hypothetical protein
MTDKPMSALAFLRAYTRQATRRQLAALSAVAALDVLIQVSAVTSVHGIARICWAVAFAATWGLAWWLLGWPPAQRWIWGGQP